MTAHVYEAGGVVQVRHRERRGKMLRISLRFDQNDAGDNSARILLLRKSRVFSA